MTLQNDVDERDTRRNAILSAKQRFGSLPDSRKLELQARFEDAQAATRL